MCSVAGQCAAAVWVFTVSGFHRFFATKPFSSETSKAERWSFGVNHGSIRDSWPIAFSGYPRGPRVVVRLGARCTQRLTYQLRLALEPECLENLRPPPEKSPEMERTRSETLKLFVVSDVGRRSTLLSSTRSTRWWQSSWPGSGAPSPA